MEDSDVERTSDWTRTSGVDRVPPLLAGAAFRLFPAQSLSFSLSPKGVILAPWSGQRVEGKRVTKGGES